jgi:hypothetical protein
LVEARLFLWGREYEVWIDADPKLIAKLFLDGEMIGMLARVRKLFGAVPHRRPRRFLHETCLAHAPKIS